MRYQNKYFFRFTVPKIFGGNHVFHDFLTIDCDTDIGAKKIMEVILNKAIETVYEDKEKKVNIDDIDFQVVSLLASFPVEDNNRNELIKIQEEYIELLGRELDEVVKIASYKWESSRIQEGAELRAKMNRLKKLIK